MMRSAFSAPPADEPARPTESGPGSRPGRRSSLAFPAGKPARLFGDGAARLAGLSAMLLGWRPDEFWRATPDELGTVFAAMMGEREAPPDRGALLRLMEQFPDQQSVR